MEYLIRTIAMALDTLPAEGRIMLLSVLLSAAFYGLTQIAAVRRDVKTAIMLRKSALVMLLALPVLLYITSLRTPVYVPDLVAFSTPFPTLVAYALLVIWLGVALAKSVALMRRWQQMLGALPQSDTPDTMIKRLHHWQRRLSVPGKIQLICDGGARPWHVSCRFFAREYVLVLPAAARNWPRGVLDVCLLTQLAQIKHADSDWLAYAAWTSALYWPFPWVSNMGKALQSEISSPSQDLAESGYADAIGWQKDLKQTYERLSGLQPYGVQMGLADTLFEPAEVAREKVSLAPVGVAGRSAFDSQVGDATMSFDEKLDMSRARLRNRYHDPHEKAYWLVAVACLFVSVLTTLTIAKAPPEFEPRFLNVKWQDQMARKIKDYTEESHAPGAVPANSEGAVTSNEPD